jgi:ribonuclease G
MSKELVISANRHETRVAVLEDDQVVEVYHQRENEYSLAGSIHKGRVTRVLPGMQSAFVDIGLDRDAFLYVSDFFEDNEEYDKIVTSVEEKVLKLDRTEPAPAQAVEAPRAVEAEEAPAPVEVAAVAEPVVEPAIAAATAPVPEREHRDDRDRRGRHSRRRRGRGGRALPDSKFYSPGQRPVQETPAPTMSEVVESPAAPIPPRAVAPEDDFLVLPGESLAKHTVPRDSAPEGQVEEEEEEQGVEVAPPAFEAVETSAPIAAHPEAEPQAELAVAVAEAAEEAETETEAGIPDEGPEPEGAAEAAAESEGLAFQPPAEEAAEAVAAQQAVEPSAEPAEEAAEVEGGFETAEDEAAAQEPEAAVEALAEGVEGGAVEEEGPEPARIPTSLTATLREQGPRYLHRVSRRMRRKGRDGRSPEAARPAGPRTSEPRANDAAPRSAPEARVAPPAGQPAARAEKSGTPSISDLLREGQEIIVQIAKEPLGQKGARITSHIALPGRFLVYMPTVDHIGVSRKIPSDEERTRLKRILQSNHAGIPGGFIVRTAGEGRSEEELRADMLFLYNLWLDMRQKAERKPAPVLVHHDLNVVERVLRDQLTPAFKDVWVDNEEIYESVLRFVQRFQPALVNRVKMYTRATPIFDEFNITSELEKALRPKVWLKSGGYIVINQTEALVAIDVNTGKFVGKSNRLEDTIVKTNTDAIKEIVRQIRLRDLGGIIVVDFIDMDERKNRQKVMQALEEAMRSDRAPNKILQFNDFGLVAITRKRVKQSLERTLCTPCPYCEGAGYVKSPQTVVGEILQEAHKIARAVEGKDVMLRVSPDVAKLLKSNQNSYLQELEEILGRTVFVKSDQQLHQEKFDLA